MTSHTSPIHVHFTHLACEFDDAELCRFGSPHVNEKELSQQLLPKIQQRTASTKRELTLQFTRSQIICIMSHFRKQSALTRWPTWKYGMSGSRTSVDSLLSPDSTAL